ncbi:DUF2642 domain-containing protein [Bacillus sp. MUM 13]|uniref:DUF2642 domain-containing protein n=1 Tax=Bacillus sp. MUM 13 TaxID=1678001 RepID=UPI0008F566B9|nr:DUF2642 domain-containing protein [Bacillus sp. MUM 13]OIK09311.1 hypothetical protein BIV59_17330 [Bacillus sp. MUM 13]
MIKQNFYEELNPLIGFNISIITNNHNVHNGFLLDVKRDFLVIQMGAKECYFSLNHIYAVSKNTRDFKGKVFDYISTQKQTLIELLNELKHHWVTVNGDSNLPFEGLLGTVTDSYIELFNKDKQFYIQLSNIHYLLKGINKKESSEVKEQKNSEGKTDNKQSEENQGKGFNADQKEEGDALEPKVNQESSAPLEKSKRQEVLPELKEEQPVQSEITKDQDILLEVNQVLEELSQLIAEPVNREGKSGQHTVSPGFEQPAARTKEHKADKDLAESMEDTAEYKNQISAEKKEKNIEVNEKEITSAINKKEIQSAIQEKHTEESLHSIPKEPKLAEKHDSKEKRAMLIKTLMESTEKMFTENRMQESQFSSLMKYAQRIHRNKRIKP